MWRQTIDNVFALLVTSRWIAFAATSLVFGSAFFWLTAVRGPLSGRVHSLPRTAARTMALLRVAALVAAIAGVAWLAATIANVTGGFENLKDSAMLRVYLFETPFGPPSLVRLALLAALAGLAVSPLPPLHRIAANALLGAVLLVSQAWFGHAVEGGPVMVVSYAAHVLGAAAWIGSLPALALATAERQGAPRTDLLSRYSAMAVAAVALVVLSGIANTTFHVGEPGQLVSTPYGRVLLAKLALVAAMLALAAANRFVLMPRLAADAPAESAAQTLRRSIALEALLALLVLGAAAILGMSPPPH